jgi:UDP-glucuronate decarboxylase
VNLGNPVEFTIRQLAEQVVVLVGGGSKLIEQPLPEDDPKQRQPDIKLAKAELGWAPTVSMAEGLPRTVDYFRKLMPVV